MFLTILNKLKLIFYPSNTKYVVVLLLILLVEKTYTSESPDERKSETIGKVSSEILMIANGSFDEELFNRLRPGKTLVVLDGACNNLYQKEIVPDYIMGDFDSISIECKEHFLSILGGDKIISLPDQSKTDLHKGIEFCDQLSASSIIIIGALGGERTDHEILNLTLLKRLHNPHRSLMIYSKKEIIQFLKDETITFEATVKAKFGLFGFLKATATSRGEGEEKGLEWELNNYHLEFGGPSSACNEIYSSPVILSIQGEALMIRPNY